MNKITKSCGICSKKFTITYYASVADNDTTDVCNRCWNNKINNHWQSTRNVLSGNKISFQSSEKRFSSPAGYYLDNLNPENNVKKNKNDKKSKENAGTTSVVKWLTNHQNGVKDPVLSPMLEKNVESLLTKLKGV